MLEDKNALLRRRAGLQAKMDTVLDVLANESRDPAGMEMTAITGYKRGIEEIDTQLDEHAKFAPKGAARPGSQYLRGNEDVFPVGMPGGGGGQGRQEERRPAPRGLKPRGFLSSLMSVASPDERDQIENFLGAVRGTVALANLNPVGDGAFLIPTFVADQIELDIAHFTPVLNVARVVQTETGAPFIYPVMSDTESAEQLASSALTGLDDVVSGDTPPTRITGPRLGAWKVSSKPILVPREIVLDSGLDVIGDLLLALVARVARFENVKYTKGNGTTECEGFVTNCTHYDVSGPLDLDMALDLTLQVPPLYRPNGTFMASDKTVKYLRKLKTGIPSDKRPLWSFGDSSGDGAGTEGTPTGLWGYPLLVNNDLPDVSDAGTISGHELAFGDFQRFLIRRAENGLPFTYVWPVPAKDGRGIILFRRSDSKLLVPTAIATLSVGGS